MYIYKYIHDIFIYSHFQSQNLKRPKNHSAAKALYIVGSSVALFTSLQLAEAMKKYDSGHDLLAKNALANTGKCWQTQSEHKTK